MSGVILKIVGVLMLIDGVWSWATPKNNHWFVGDLGRLIRIGLGITLIFI